MNPNEKDLTSFPAEASLDYVWVTQVQRLMKHLRFKNDKRHWTRPLCNHSDWPTSIIFRCFYFSRKIKSTFSNLMVHSLISSREFICPAADDVIWILSKIKIEIKIEIKTTNKSTKLCRHNVNRRASESIFT